MIERILAILKQKNLSPSQFADEIGVQRSSISHLISGRNNPSLEFIQKILSRFPEINTEWMLTGNGTMNREGNSESGIINQEGTLFENPAEPEKKEIIKPGAARRRVIDPPAEGKRIEKIVFFYSDKSFREFIPEQIQL
jgi:transcriptional regulator with XRE-family HTH domain